MTSLINNARQTTDSLRKSLGMYNPERQLKLGYSIVHSQGIVVREVSQISPGQEIDVRVQDGSFVSEVKIINKK